MSHTHLIQIKPLNSLDIKPETRLVKRGCEYCPMNKVKGINKIFGKVKGKKIFIWAQSPGPQENKAEKELVGPSGKFLWKELKRVGIKREKCDIQNVVRCMPADIIDTKWPPFKMRSPSKEEVKCCSIYNEKALEKSKAKLNLVFGAVAAASLLGKELKKDQRIFYSDRLKGWVVYLDHPSYFIRQGYTADSDRPANDSLNRFRKDLERAKALLHKNKFDRYEFLKKQKYIGVTSREQARIVYRKLKKKAIKEGIRLIADMEEGKVNDKGEPDEEGTSVALCCGFAYKPGLSYVFALRSPDSGISERTYRFNKQCVRNLFTDPRIKIGFHYGVSDTEAVKRLLGVTVRGYDYDTLHGEYFRDPDAKAYGLNAIAERRYDDFLHYKSIEGPDAFTPAFKQHIEKTKNLRNASLLQQTMAARTKGGLNLARLPWKKMVLYNGADCHLTKLVERDTVKYVNPPLMKIYIDAAPVLKRMERDKACQPLFDYHWHRKVRKIFNIRLKILDYEIRKLAGKYSYLPVKADRPQWIDFLARKDKSPKVHKKRFNPNSTDHILWLLFDKLKYRFRSDERGDKPNTRAGTLKRLALKHKKAKLVVAYRKVKKAKGTYVKGYLKCADLNKGHLRTNWKTTGTATGRMSSGKTKDKKNDAVINFQNVHGDPLIQCLLISDRRWEKLYKYWIKYGPFNKHNWKKFRNLYVDLGFDFSQNELRELAEESGDKNLIRAFSTRKKWYCKECKTEHASDPHVEVGHDLTGWKKEKIAHNDRVRKLIKNMQFGLVYGLKGKGLYLFIIALGVETTQEEVDNYHRKYFRKFKGVEKLQRRLRAFAEKNKYVINRFGFRRNLNVDQQKEMGEDWEGAYWGNQAINCVDFKTEALTQRGWIKGYKLKAGDILLTYNKDRKCMEWQSATDIKLFPNYEGKIHRLQSKSFNAVTTSDHRWIRCNGKEFISKAIPKGVSIPRVMPYIGPSTSRYSDDFIRLIGWVLTDGSYGRRLGKDKGLGKINQNFDCIDQKGKGWANQGVYVCQSKPKNVKRIDKLFRRLSLETNMPYRTKALKNRSLYKEIFWSFSGQYGRWFKGMFPDRELTPEFLIQLPKRQLNILLRTMLRGDSFLCRFKKGMDAYQMLVYLCDKASTIRYRDMSMYKPISDKLSNIPNMTGIWGGKILKRDKISMDWVKHKITNEKIGMWCPMVPNTFFVARRKGTVYITGNTPIQGASHLYLMMSIAAICRYPEKYKELINPNKEIHDALYFGVRLRNLWKAMIKGKDLMLKEPIRIVKNDFKLKKRVPLSAKPKAGFRFGVQVEGIGEGKLSNVWDFLNAWCEENKKLEEDYKSQLKQHNLDKMIETVLQ